MSGETAMNGRTVKRGESIRTLKYLIFLFCLLNLTLFFFHALSIITFPGSFEYGEGILIYQANMPGILGFYSDIHRAPFNISSYTPVAVILYSLIVKTLGLNLIALRILPLLCQIFMILFMGLIIRRFSGDMLIAIIFPLLFLGDSAFMYWTALIRVDYIALMFNMAGACLFLWGKDDRKYPFSLLLFTLAFFTKQSAITGMVAFYVCLFIFERDRFRKYIWIGPTAVILISLLLNLLTGGRYLLHTLFLYMAKPMDIKGAILIFKGLFLDRLPIMAMGLISLVYLLVNMKKVGDRTVNFVVTYFITTLIFLFSIFKAGSATNHYLEMLGVMYLVMGIAVSMLEKAGRETILSLFLLVFLINTSVVEMGQFKSFLIKEKAGVRKALNFYARRKAVAGKILDIIKHSPDPVWVEDSFYLLQSGRPVVMNNPSEFCYFGDSYWKENPLPGMFRNGNFNTVILGDYCFEGYESRMDRRLLQAMKSRYRLYSRIGPHYVFKPEK